MKKLILSFTLLISMFSFGLSSPVAISAEATSLEIVEQGSGCPYVCREEFKLCVKKKRKKCRTKLNSCLRMCPR